MTPDFKKVMRSKSFMFHFLPTLVVLFAFLSVTIWGWMAAKTALQRENTQAATLQATEIEDAISKRFLIYEEVLRGGVGLFAASDTVTSQDWHDFVSLFNLQKRYPGSVAIGYIAMIKDSDLNDYVQEQRQAGISDFTITRRSSNSDVHAILQYIEPGTDRSRQVIGYDLSGDHERQDAMQRSAASGQAVITDRIRLALDQSDDPEPGFAMYMPVYKKDVNITTTNDRPKAVVGYVYMPFRGADLLRGIFEHEPPEVGLRVYSSQARHDKLIYENQYYKYLNQNKSAISTTRTIEVDQARWVIDYKFSPTIVSAVVRHRPTGVLWAGILLSLLIAGLVLALLVVRTRTLASIKEREIQSAKDDLLSLASHQLRTPATGVKQYIGMILEGYAGRVKSDQKAYLQKAYESNERQLQIINDLLYVAKADAGRIVLAKRDINVKELLKDIVAEQKGTASDKNILLKLQLPRRNSINVYADKHCLRMSIENLVNNAIKYTPNGGRIMISVTQKDDTVNILVKDNGVGIKNEDLPLLFKRFSRVPNELSAQVSGSGIGLYLARHLIELHGGTITVKSTPGKGTTFIMHMPKNEVPLNS